MLATPMTFNGPGASACGHDLEVGQLLGHAGVAAPVLGRPGHRRPAGVGQRAVPPAQHLEGVLVLEPLPAGLDDLRGQIGAEPLLQRAPELRDGGRSSQRRFPRTLLIVGPTRSTTAPPVVATHGTPAVTNATMPFSPIAAPSVAQSRPRAVPIAPAARRGRAGRSEEPGPWPGPGRSTGTAAGDGPHSRPGRRWRRRRGAGSVVGKEPSDEPRSSARSKGAMRLDRRAASSSLVSVGLSGHRVEDDQPAHPAPVEGHGQHLVDPGADGVECRRGCTRGTGHLGHVGVGCRSEHGQQEIVLRAELPVEGAGRQSGMIQDVLHAGPLEAVAAHHVQRGIHQPAPFGAGLGGDRRIEHAPVVDTADTAARLTDPNTAPRGRSRDAASAAGPREMPSLDITRG